MNYTVDRLSALILVCWISAGCLLGELNADELLPPDRPIAEVIDHYLEARLTDEGVTPAPQASDTTLIRRLTLDLESRTPTVQEVTSYLSSEDTNKRELLVNRLTDSQLHARHMATELNTLLNGPDETGPDLRDDYLLVALQENRPWNRVFRELIGETPAAGNPERFVSERLSNVDVLTRDVSSIFFGINVTCCQCHTHPYIGSLTSDYFHGMKGFFTRSYEFHGKLFEKTFGPKIEFEGEEVGLMFLTGSHVETPVPDTEDLRKSIQDETKHIDDLRKSFTEAEKIKSEALATAESKEEERKKILADLEATPEKTKAIEALDLEIAEAKTKADEVEFVYPENASYSYRNQLADIAFQPESESLFARSIVNRIWNMLFGYGLVMRTDQMHEENPGSHPQLLDWLERDMKTHDYDLRRLVRGIVTSRAYSRSSQWLSKDTEAPSKELFAVANLRPLTPMQYGVSIVLCGDPNFPPTADTLETTMAEVEKTARDHFGEIIQQPKNDLEIGANETLGISNDEGRLDLIGAKLVPELLKIEHRDEQAETAVWSVLSRPPTPDERQILTDYLQLHAGSDGKQLEAALKQIVWSLTTSAEFRFNH